MKGKFHAIRIHDAKNVESQDGLKIFGVRIAKFLPPGWVHFQETTPSKELLFRCKDLEKSGKWNKEAFETIYKPRFFEEIKQNPKAMEEIKTIKKTLDAGQDVYYACYCKDVSICHRSLIGAIFEANGYDVVLG